MLSLERSQYGQLPKEPGVYLFIGGKNDVLYVGKAKELKARVTSYFQNPSLLEEKTRVLVSQIKKIHAIIVESELESLLLEAHLIKKYRPKYNIRMSDDKMYPLIRITLKDKYPAVLYARRSDDPSSTYFGPFPSAGTVKSVLRTIRRIFPFHSTPNHPKRLCLYHHLGLCPCLTAQDTEENRKEYRKNIRQIIRFLEGETKSIIRDLEKERDTASKSEDFEKAAVLQRKIDSLTYITQPFRKPFEYDLNPNLRSDLRQAELKGLQNALQDAGLTTQHLGKIECYDISNTQGTNATASLVVLTEGEIDKNKYRKFKIKKDGKPNDFAMMAETLTRRLKHTEWEYPDLLIVDGGKGQVSAALEIFKEKNITIPLIGLAKREETIIIPVDQENFTSPIESNNHVIPGLFTLTGTRNLSSGETTTKQTGIKGSFTRKLYGTNEENFVEVSLPDNSPSLHLIQRIRNEAHRFAITYHRKLRSKNVLS
jgi:excinuclease ABC subunit C